MKILHIDTERGFRGGERQVLWLVHGLKAAGHEQGAAVRPRSELGNILEREGMKVHELRRHQAWHPRTVAGLRKLARENSYDIVHAHTGNAHTLAWRAFSGRLPVIVTRRVDFAVKSNPLSRRKYTDPSIRFAAISNGVRSVLIQGGVEASRIEVVPSGIDPDRVRNGKERAALRATWGLEEPGPLVGFIGAFVDHKDPLNLVNAVPMLQQHLPNAKVVFVGKGELRSQMEARAKELGAIDDVVFAGWREDIAECLGSFDIFVMPSKLEGLCTSLLDAQAAGVPCVATTAGGIPDIIEHECNGLLVPPRDSNSLGNALVRLWNDESMRQSFISAGKCVIERRFTKETMVAGTLEVYERTIREWDGIRRFR